MFIDCIWETLLGSAAVSIQVSMAPNDDRKYTFHSLAKSIVFSSMFNKDFGTMGPWDHTKIKCCGAYTSV